MQIGLPIFSPAGYLGIGQSRSLPILRRENTFQYIDSLTWTTRQAHAEVRRRRAPPADHRIPDQSWQRPIQLQHRLHGQPGAERGNAMASMLLGYPTLNEQDFCWPGRACAASRAAYTSPTTGASTAS